MNCSFMDNNELIENIRTANPWFVGLYMETFLNNISFLSNIQFKKDFIYDIYRYDPIVKNENLLDINAKVESLLNIIMANKVCDALKIIIESDTDNIYDIYAREEAIYLLALINKGSFKLPIIK